MEKKLTLKLLEVHAPGLIDFLDNDLPGRTEAAFIRGLLYQWVKENRGKRDFQKRLLQVLDGPGGRMVSTTLYALPEPKGVRPSRRGKAEGPPARSLLKAKRSTPAAARKTTTKKGMAQAAKR